MLAGCQKSGLEPTGDTLAYSGTQDATLCYKPMRMKVSQTRAGSAGRGIGAM